MKQLIIAITLLLTSSTMGQDIHFSQMGYSPLTLNPALAGANYDLQANINYRSQWNSVAEPFQTLAASVDARLNSKNKGRKKALLAVGLNFFNDRAGEAVVVTNNVNLNIAAHVILSEGHTLGAGVYGGWAQRSLNFRLGKWGSQYDGQQYNPLLVSGENFTSAAFSLFDVGAGMVYTYNSADSRIAENDQKQLNVGFATYHLNRPGYSFLSQPQERLYIRYSAFVNGAFGIRRTRMILEPGVYFHQQGNAREIMYGLYGRYVLKAESRITDFVQRTTLALGLFCRNKDALIAKAHFEWNGIGVGFAYDFNLFSSLISMSRSRGGMEFSLRWIVPDLYKHSGRIR